MEHQSTGRRFAICIDSGQGEDLEVGKVYQVLGDESAAREGYTRVIDESREDYLYPAGWFVPIVLPDEAERALAAASAIVPA